MGRARPRAAQGKLLALFFRTLEGPFAAYTLAKPIWLGTLRPRSATHAASPQQGSAHPPGGPPRGYGGPLRTPPLQPRYSRVQGATLSHRLPRPFAAPAEALTIGTGAGGVKGAGPRQVRGLGLQKGLHVMIEPAHNVNDALYITYMNQYLHISKGRLLHASKPSESCGGLACWHAAMSHRKVALLWCSN